MLESTMEFIRCVKCASALSIQSEAAGREIEEGFLNCTLCSAAYPIISKVPLLVADLASYLSARTSLAGDLLLLARTSRMKEFVKGTMRVIAKPSEDTSSLDRKWLKIYKRSSGCEFYRQAYGAIAKLPACSLVLEHGCSIGLVSRYAAKKCKHFLGIDKSFYGIMESKRLQSDNSDFVVADSLAHPFGARKFDLVIALNMLDIVEPRSLLKMLVSQTGRFLMVSDPYDFDRGKDSVKHEMSPAELRKFLRDEGLSLIQKTGRQSHIPWNLKINSRLELHYKVDMVVARRKPRTGLLSQQAAG